MFISINILLQVRQNLLSEETRCLIPGYSHHQSDHDESEILFKVYGNGERDVEWFSDKKPLYFQLTPHYRRAEPEVVGIIIIFKDFFLLCWFLL